MPHRITNGVMLTGVTINNAALAIMDAVDRNLADVISISLGAQSVVGNRKEMHALGRAVDHAYERGVLVVGAAGQTQDAPQLVGFTVYPGRYSRAILVGGLNSDLEVCFDYEIGGSYVDVWAWLTTYVAPMPCSACQSRSSMSPAMATGRPTPRSMSRVLPRCGYACTAKPWTRAAIPVGGGSRPFEPCCAPIRRRSPATM